MVFTQHLTNVHVPKLYTINIIMITILHIYSSTIIYKRSDNVHPKDSASGAT